MNVLKILGRDQPLFNDDVACNEQSLSEVLQNARVLIVGGAGTIGQAVARELFKRNPRALHIIDLSENNLVELVRDLRSGLGYSTQDFLTAPLDIGGTEFDAFIESQAPYDIVCNLSALKHVRSEKDPYSLCRMLKVNVLHSLKLARIAASQRAKKYFAVSTDKATNPVNLMGASKRIMEKFLHRESSQVNVSMARFANVAFSDGSLLHGFIHRLNRRQPLSVPRDVQRYFFTQEEAGALCMLSITLGGNLDNFIPHPDAGLALTNFPDIASRFLESHGYEAFFCESETEARQRCVELLQNRQWPVHVFKSDTTGEKPFEEFHTSEENVDIATFNKVGIIKQAPVFDAERLLSFETALRDILRSPGPWDKPSLVGIIQDVVPELHYQDVGKYLDSRM